MFKGLFLAICFPVALFSQSSVKVWTEIGVKGSITKKLDWAAEVSTRFGVSRLETFFPQVSLKYKVTKWFRPSIDYRAIFNINKFGNFSFTNRLNLNAEFKKDIKRLSVSGRIRYQYSFNRLISNELYDVEFDQAVRFKPQISYDLNNSFITPVVSIEYFYNPTPGPLGQRFTKYRAFIGIEFEFDSPHEISVGYILDQQINVPKPKTKHILSISYAYNLGFSKD